MASAQIIRGCNGPGQVVSGKEFVGRGPDFVWRDGVGTDPAPYDGHGISPRDAGVELPGQQPNVLAVWGR